MTRVMCAYSRDTLIYVENRNITFSLPVDLVRQAKIHAAEHDTTINALVRELLQDRLTREGRVRAASQRLLALAERGLCFTADPESIRHD
jgi:plasmid stability protein